MPSPPQLESLQTLLLQGVARPESRWAGLWRPGAVEACQALIETPCQATLP